MAHSRHIPAFFLSLAVSVLVGLQPAIASPKSQATGLCYAKGIDDRIAGCTALLESGGQSASSRATAFLNRATAYYDKGDWDRAIADFDQAIRLKHDHAAAFNYRGNTYRAKGDQDRAIADFDQAIRLMPDYASAFSNRGSAFRAKGDLNRALADFDRAIDLKPDFAPAFYNRGSAYDAKGDSDRAIADLDQAIRLAPDFAPAFHNRGAAYYDKGAWDRAIADFDQAIRLKPDYASAYNNRGNAYRAKDDPDRAIADFDQAIRLKPDYASAYNNRGSAFRAKGDLDRAMADFDQALRLQPDFTPALDNRKAVLALGNRQPAGDLPKLATPAAVEPDGSHAAPAVQKSANLRRAALVIGNSAYRSVAQLPNPARDAELIAGAFRQVGVDDVTVVHDLDRAGMVAALKTFANKADHYDWAIIYYAGHGMEINGINYLIPVDAELRMERDVPDEAIALQSFLNATEGARQLHLVVLDACRNNPFAARIKLASASRSVSRGLARVEPDDGTLVVYAAREGTTADDGDGSNSPFARAFANRLVQPGLELTKLVGFVRRDVLTATNKGQEPYTYGSLPPEDFYFLP